MKTRIRLTRMRERFPGPVLTVVGAWKQPMQWPEKTAQEIESRSVAAWRGRGEKQEFPLWGNILK